MTMTEERMPTPHEVAAALALAFGITPIVRRESRYTVWEKRTSLMTCEKELWIKVWCRKLKDGEQRWKRCRAAARRDPKTRDLPPLSLVVMYEKLGDTN
jgi:hypothetical protein